MAYDEDLADRIRLTIGAAPDLSEMRMFGGLAFLVNGNMAVAASGNGGMMARVDPESAHEWVDGTSVETMEMRGRLMPGWLRVSTELLEDDAKMREWVDRGVSYARSLPPKAKKK